MDGATIGLVTVLWLLSGYLFYGRHLRRRLFEPADCRPTPAVAQRDDVDFRPANPIILFGHHFSSIAGAGPIVGPILAVGFFGWGLPLAWILLAVVLMGAVHDYTALMASVRSQGRSVPDLARDVVGSRARALLQVFVLLTLVLVVAAFIDVATRSFLDQPQIVVPSLGLIPWAMGFGSLVYRRGLPVLLATIVGIGGLAALILIGFRLPVALHSVQPSDFPGAWAVVSVGLDPETSRKVWYVVLAAYGLAASALPVWLLLQPRDYLAAWILVVGMALGFAGLAITRPAVQAAAFTGPMSERGPVWPMLFILIACGAISGFHSIVSGGTTSRQLAREGHGLAIGYGAMLTEGALAVLALLTVAAGLPWDELQRMVVEAQGAGPIVAFGKGFGTLTAPLLGATAGVLFGVTMINAFVMTTLDTTVRLSRFLMAELAGSWVPWLRGRWTASLVVTALALAVVMKGGQATLWPLFATANQLVAALALLVLSAWLVGRGKPRGYTLIPALVMLATTMAALVWQARRFLWAYEPGMGPNILLGTLALALLVLALVVARDAFCALRVAQADFLAAKPPPSPQ